MRVDLSSPSSVHTFGAAFGKRSSALDVLVSNAAVSLPVREVTSEGLERNWRSMCSARTSSRRC
ncbi:hypothetical protein [Segeticoccus sp.]|uniref:hypothetical protein n=1 Tax=Segeticoccus sp. TaxID=2706531 RepID=UPI002D7F7AF9|nr:hypothetical protein [Segeticoccus sp.]